MPAPAAPHPTPDHDDAPPATLVAAGATLATVLAALTVGEYHPTATPHVPWWALTALFVVAEVEGLGMVRDRAAVTSPMSRVVLVIGLYLASPLELIVAHALGSTLAAAPRWRRDTARAVAVIVGATLSTTVGTWGYLAMTELTAPRGPEGWADGIVAAASAVAVSTLLGAATVWARGRHHDVTAWVGRTLVSDVLALATGLVAVEILRTDPYAAWLLLLPALAAYAVRHQYEVAEWRAEALGTLHDVARRLQRATARDHAIAVAVTEARAVCRAATATIVVQVEGELLRWSSDLLAPLPATARDRTWLATLSPSDTATLVASGPTAEPPRTRGRSPTLLAPLLRGDGILGYLALQRPRGHPFTRLERQVAETLVASLGVALETVAHLEGLADRHRHAAQLLAEQDQVTTELQRVSDAKSVFLATTSHELRAPLGALLAQTELLDQLLPAVTGDETCRRLARGARGDAEHLLHLVDDLLDLSRIEAGRLELRREPTDLRQVTEAAVTSLRATLEGDPDRLTSGGAHHAELDGDPVRLRQIVTNLVHNAARATEAGGEVHVELGARGDEVTLEVTDTGTGIAGTELERMFAAFERGRPHDRGLGLGLTIARHLVEAHGGTLEAHSTLGVGSRFTVRLPTHPPLPVPHAPRADGRLVGPPR